MTSGPTLIDALVMVTGSATASSRAAAFRVINQALRESWFEAKLRATCPPGTDVDDVKQKVLMSLLGTSNASGPRRQFEGTTLEQAHAFLMTIAKRRAIELARARKNETKLADGALARIPDTRGPYHELIAKDLQRRLDELIEVAASIQDRPDAQTLRRHVSAVLVGMSAADTRPGSDARLRARLRKERSRSLDLMRRALSKAIESGADQGRPDELDWVIERLLETPKSSDTQEE